MTAPIDPVLVDTPRDDTPTSDERDVARVVASWLEWRTPMESPSAWIIKTNPVR